MICFDLAIDQIAQFGLSSIKVIYYSAQLFRKIKNDAMEYGENMAKIVGGEHNGGGDALRHCYLMCQFAKEFSPKIAQEIGNNHEHSENTGILGQGKGEMNMDFKNNTVGISCATSSNDCGYSCMEKHYNGELYDLNGPIDNPVLITGSIVPND